MVGRPGSFSFHGCGFEFVCVRSASAGAFCLCALQYGHAEKCKTGRTTDLPGLRHGVGIGRWCCRFTCLRRPPSQRHRQKTKARHLGLDALEGVLAIFFPQRKRAPRKRGRKKAVTRPLTLACRIVRPPNRIRGGEVKI